MNISVESFGGADTVTGSCHLIKIEQENYLIDSGLFQGADLKLHKNISNLPFEILSIEAIILTHAHLDHCGLLPLYAKKGYSKPIYATEATKDLAAIILTDSAKIQQGNANSHNKKTNKKSQHVEPLYRHADVERVLNLIKVVEPHEINHHKNLKFRLFPAGHIPGAVSASLEIADQKILFSGDLGRDDDQIMRPPVIEGGHDCIFIESTYGGHQHVSGEVEKLLPQMLKHIIKTGCVLLIPAFTVARSQMLVKLFHDFFEKNPQLKVPIFMDSPMGLKVNKVFEKHHEWLKLTKEEYNTAFTDVTEVDEKWEADKLESFPEAHIILTSSGMMTGGKVLKHFSRLALDKDNIVFLPGYMGEDTLGNRLASGEREFSYEQESIKVNCQIIQTHQLSAHADQKQLSKWLEIAANSKERTSIFLIHGENEEKEKFIIYLNELGFKKVEKMNYRKAVQISV